MALPEEPLSIVEQWKKKNYEMSQSNDTVVSLLTKGIETMAVVLNKNSDLKRVQRALLSLESERSLALQFDDLRNDEARSLVYGHIECLHFTLSELTKERNQVKECEEMFTQTEEIPSQLESPFDENLIKMEDFWGDEMAIKDEEMFNYSADAHTADGGISVDFGDVSRISENDRVQSEMPTLNDKRDEGNFENEDADEMMNESKDNAIMDGVGEMDSSEIVEMEKKSESINVSRSEKSVDCESLDNFDEDSEPAMKKLKADNEFSMETKKPDDKKSGSASLKGKSREMKCIECKFLTASVPSYIDHLRKKHSTTPRLAGLALRCDCGVQAISYRHGLQCDIANYTVVQVRGGPIHRFEDQKTTPQCILCDAYPSTAYGYIQHLHIYHKSRLSVNGIYLLCSCGAKYRHHHPDSKHTKECTHREFSLHKIDDK